MLNKRSFCEFINIKEFYCKFDWFIQTVTVMSTLSAGCQAISLVYRT